MTVIADLAVIGGSGLYALLTDAEEHRVDTPYGQPSDPIAVARIKDRSVAFLPRHGRDHRFPPHRIPYRANIWALHQLGVRQIVAPCAVGGLRPELGAGTFVIPDQLIDRTSGRIQTFYGDRAVHVNFADPYCPTGREVARKVAGEQGIETHDGTMVVVEGPRFSTRAESRWYKAMGSAVVSMTGHPEAILARELAVCYTAIALVTDLDAGVEGDHGVTQEEVFRVFGENIERLRGLLFGVVAALPEERDCPCARALEDMWGAKGRVQARGKHTTNSRSPSTLLTATVPQCASTSATFLKTGVGLVL